MKTKIYEADTLFSGEVIGKDPDTKYVAVPGGQKYKARHNFSKEKNFIVDFLGKRMIIENWNKADAFRVMNDQQGRGHYTLAYFQWKPIQEPKYEVHGNTITILE